MILGDTMADSGPVTATNGDARRDIAVLAARQEACQKVQTEAWVRSDKRWDGNHEEHTEMFDRLRGLETEQARMGTRIGMWAGFGALLASVLVQVLFKLVIK